MFAFIFVNVCFHIWFMFVFVFVSCFSFIFVLRLLSYLFYVCFHICFMFAFLFVLWLLSYLFYVHFNICLMFVFLFVLCLLSYLLYVCFHICFMFVFIFVLCLLSYLFDGCFHICFKKHENQVHDGYQAKIVQNFLCHRWPGAILVPFWHQEVSFPSSLTRITKDPGSFLPLMDEFGITLKKGLENWTSLENMQTNIKVGGLTSMFNVHIVHFLVFWWPGKKVTGPIICLFSRNWGW